MEGYIDIHSHILPQIDDGSKSMEMTMNMLKMAYEEGIRIIVATPHAHEGRSEVTVEELEKYVYEVEKHFNEVEKLNEVEDQYNENEVENKNVTKNLPEVELESIDINKSVSQLSGNNEEVITHNNKITNYNPGSCSKIKIYLGCEIYYSHESIRLLNEKLIPTIAGTRYILVEFSPVADYRYIKNGIQDFLLEGYYPIVAHVERYQNVIKDLNNVAELIEMGAYIQVNSMSITGEFGKQYQGIARKLLKKHFIHLIGTDSHSDGTRAPRIKKCADYIKKKYGEDYARELLIDNGSKVLSGQYI